MREKCGIFYVRDPYISHRRVAAEYKSLLKKHFRLVSFLRDAKIVVLHVEPHDYEGLYRAYPSLYSQYVVSYCVWEASELPECYSRSLRLVQEVWTASSYCAEIIRKVHHNVVVIPHIIQRDVLFGHREARFIKKITRFDSDCFYYLHIGRSAGTRKNTRGLIDTFARTRKELPNGRLIIKLPAHEPALFVRDERIIQISSYLSERQMNALYSCVNAVVSAHHAEGWGLPLSDSFCFRKPVVATRYSGNLDFMRDENSFLIDSQEHLIPSGDTFGLFTEVMSWASPDLEMLNDCLYRLYSDSLSKEVSEKVEQAHDDSRTFSRHAVGEMLFQAVERISCSL